MKQSEDASSLNVQKLAALNKPKCERCDRVRAGLLKVTVLSHAELKAGV